MDHFLPLPQAARRYAVSETRLHELIQAGSIRSAFLSGETIVNETDLLNTVQKIERHLFDHLNGQPIGIREAAIKYNVPAPTLSRWVKRGLVKVLRANPEPGQKKLLDEADCAYLAAVHNAIGGQGKWVFDSDGNPYQPKKR